jgi:hypothetical protein
MKGGTHILANREQERGQHKVNRIKEGYTHPGKQRERERG